MTYEQVNEWIEAQYWDFDEFENYEDFIEEVKSQFNNNEALINAIAYKPHENSFQTDLEIFFENSKANNTKE